MNTAILEPRGPGYGPAPNVIDIPTPPLQAGALSIMFGLLGVALIVVALRLWTRTTMRTLGIDDLLCSFALLADILVCGSLYMFLKLNYYGWEDEKVPDDWDSTAGLWWNFFEQICYNPVLAFVKCSVLCFIMRIGGHKDAIFRAIWVLMGITIAHAIAVFFGALFQCVPIEANWHPELRADPNTRCIDNSFHIIQSAITIATDLAILVLPFWIFLGLRMPRATKIAVLGIFTIGACVPIVAIVRLINLYRLLYLGEKARHHNIAYVWTAVETNLAVISCSMPALRPLLSRWYPTLSGGGNSSGMRNGPVYGNSRRRTGGSSTVQAGSAGGSRHYNRDSTNYMLDELRPSWKQSRKTEARGRSPTGSEEEIIPNSGIMRTTNFNVVYESAGQSVERSDTGSNMSKEASHTTHVTEYR
ncbi:related to integral membrane protein PTH11 [Cephalotrichum gorgonifer]|uniref:Related to integral membrane protein PTH11 n=1 Tax=Cephalotrichum gorgonifer TaxID=2041049 RepID=A0AAE8N2X6_9PEZI|nr:related to integral membrane protein PTH11 [Cephalotrichum gorgonifer]